MNVCSFPSCFKPLHGMSGLCKGHYNQRRKGRALTPLLRSGNTTCAYEGCPKHYYARGYCSGHYQQINKGKPLVDLSPRANSPRGIDLPEKLKLHALPPTSDGCIEWGGKRNRFGYGVIYIPGGKQMMAHRAAYEVVTGSPIPKGLTIHHACANRACIAPDHLQAVTQRENTAEMFERNFYLSRIAELEAVTRRYPALLDG